MSNDNTPRPGGMGTGGALGVLFVALKLCGVIDWSWWWVLAPFWIGLSLALVFLAGFILYALVR